MADRIRVFGHLNHLSHQYELLKLAKTGKVKFSYLENNVRRWSRYSARPEPTTWLTPDEFEWIQYYQPGKYDVAILHADQQMVDPFIGKGQIMRDLTDIVQDIPKILIQHGTPLWDSTMTEEIVMNGGMVQTRKGYRNIIGMREMAKSFDVMVVNSYESVDRWKGVHPNIYPIIHGLDPNEWIDLPKEPRVVLPLSPGGLDEYYNRSLCTAIKGAVKERTGLDVMHPNVNISFEHDNWTEYREFIGSSLIGIFPFKDSPMPRSRSEFMLSGGVTLTSRYHGASNYIEHGVDGFIMPDNPLSYAEAIHTLVNDCYREATMVGKRGKEKATKLFGLQRYHNIWLELLTNVVAGRPIVWDGSRIWDDLQLKDGKKIGAQDV